MLSTIREVFLRTKAIRAFKRFMTCNVQIDIVREMADVCFFLPLFGSVLLCTPHVLHLGGSHSSLKNALEVHQGVCGEG